MRDSNVFGINRCLPRMSWNPQNLYNLWRRSLGSQKGATTFKKADSTLFQQRWVSKRFIRAYHGDYVTEKAFKRWFLPERLPDVRERSRMRDKSDAKELAWWRGDDREVDVLSKSVEQQNQDAADSPVGSLMLAELERRIDIIVFRACFAHSVYEARRLVIHGYVYLNGRLETHANTRVAPGDMISVDPKAIRLFQKPPNWIQPGSPQSTTSTRPSVEKPAESNSEESESESESEETESLKKTSSKAEPSEPESSSTTALPKPKGPPRRDLALDHINTPFYLPPYAAPFLFVPAYLEVSFLTCSVIYLRHPTARPGYSEVPTPYEADGEVMRLTWEYYSKVRPKIRSKRQKAREPTNRKVSGRFVDGLGNV